MKDEMNLDALTSEAIQEAEANAALKRRLGITVPNYKKLLKSLLNKVNRVTSSHRHGVKIDEYDLDDLCKRQIEVEEAAGWL